MNDSYLLSSVPSINKCVHLGESHDVVNQDPVRITFDATHSSVG